MKSLVVSFTFLTLSLITCAQTARMVKDAQTIQSVLTDLVKAWNIHDTGEFSILFSEDADYTDVHGMNVHGIKEIEKFCGKRIDGWVKNSLLKITDRKIRFIT